MILSTEFFSHDARHVAQALIGKIIRRKFKGKWLAVRIIETEAYYIRGNFINQIKPAILL